MSQIALTLIFLGIAAILLLRNVFRADIVSILLMLALGLSGILTPQEAFAGFSRSAVIFMMAAFILAEGLKRSGIAERMGRFIIQLFGASEQGLLFGVTAAAAFFLLFMNNVAAVSLLLPSTSGMARKSKVSLSKLLMPVAFGASLGGMATLLTTTNIIVSGVLHDSNLIGFNLLSFAPVGGPLAIAGVVYMALFGRRLLPDKSPEQQLEKSGAPDELIDSYNLSDRLVRAQVTPNEILDGVTLQKSGLRGVYHLNVIALERDERILPIKADTQIKGNDILFFMARPEDIGTENLQSALTVLPSGEWQEDYLSIPGLRLIEVAIPPRSHLAAQTLRNLNFEQKFGAKVLAIWRQGRSIRTRLEKQPLELGDGLLLQGTESTLKLLRTEPGLLVLAEPGPPATISRRGWLTAFIMLTTLALAAIFTSSMTEIMLTGAICMVLIGALSMDQAYQAVDWRSLFLVAGMLSVGVAITKTGTADMLSAMILNVFGSAGHYGLLAGLVLLTVLLTQVINGPAAVTVIAPIAITTAQQVGMEPRSVAMAVTVASSIAFMSPLAHAVNVMVMGAGGYTSKDYARVGIPLTILLVVILLLLLPFIMPIG